jgi:hypothetical protein
MAIAVRSNWNFQLTCTQLCASYDWSTVACIPILSMSWLVELPIDYRCDDENKNLLSWGDILVSLRS